MDRQQIAQVIRIVLYVMLAISAATAFGLSDPLWAAAQSGTVPFWAALLPACTFTLFVLVYTIDRLLLVKRRHFPTGRAFFQIVFAVVFLSLLWPQQAAQIQAVRQNTHHYDTTTELLQHPDAEVRAMVCELLALRGAVDATAELEAVRRNDPSPTVRAACTAALDRLRSHPPLPTE